MSPILYLTRNGLLEPLGQSQVLAYLRGLSCDYAITLITYEKSEDWADTSLRLRVKAECDRYGIRWLPQKFRSKPSIVAPAFSMLRMVCLVWREVRSGHAKLIHARSYIPAAVALVVNKMTGVPFIFDMRALWPEELIVAKRLKRGSLLHKTILVVERACLSKAAAVVSLTHAAVEYLKIEYPNELSTQQLLVIPTCADLNRFTPRLKMTQVAIVHGCIGTLLSGWFRTDWLAAWLSTVAKQNPDDLFEIVTRDDAVNVRKTLDPENMLDKRLNIKACLPEEMPDAVRGHDVSVMFFTDGLSKLGSAPTRLAEVLGCGLPVVANEGVGDVAKILRQNNVGVIIEGLGQEHMEAGLVQLDKLRADPELSGRCRQTAQNIFSLDNGTDNYRALYTQILLAARVVR